MVQYSYLRHFSVPDTGTARHYRAPQQTLSQPAYTESCCPNSLVRVQFSPPRLASPLWKSRYRKIRYKNTQYFPPLFPFIINTTVPITQNYLLASPKGGLDMGILLFFKRSSKYTNASVGMWRYATSHLRWYIALNHRWNDFILTGIYKNPVLSVQWMNA